VSTVPFVVRVGRSQPRVASGRPAPLLRVRFPVTVAQVGYEPPRARGAEGEPVVLAFTRRAPATAGWHRRHPALGVRRELPVGETVLVRFTPAESGEIRSTAGWHVPRD
jgi:plastocyanin domain-containing protein